LVVRVVTGYSAVDLRSYVEFAADQAGVDYAVAPSIAGATIHFIARHEDRRIVRKRAAACSVDLLAFRRASAALALVTPADVESQQIWRRLIQARPQAHMCGGIPTLVLNDVGGLVGALRRRAEDIGATVRINPEVCGCVTNR
jgi:hypothetical protein